MLASKLYGHCYVISNCSWRHQRIVNQAGETRGRRVKIVVFYRGLWVRYVRKKSSMFATQVYTLFYINTMSKVRHGWVIAQHRKTMDAVIITKYSCPNFRYMYWSVKVGHDCPIFPWLASFRTLYIYNCLTRPLPDSCWCRVKHTLFSLLAFYGVINLTKCLCFFYVSNW